MNSEETPKPADYGGNVVPFEERLGHRTFDQGGPIPGGSGGGGMGGLESRVAKLEAHAEHIRDDVAAMRPSLQDIRERFSTIEERITHLPTHGQSVALALAIVAGAGALIVFQGQIQTWLGFASTLGQ